MNQSSNQSMKLRQSGFQPSRKSFMDLSYTVETAKYCTWLVFFGSFLPLLFFLLLFFNRPRNRFGLKVRGRGSIIQLCRLFRAGLR